MEYGQRLPASSMWMNIQMFRSQKFICVVNQTLKGLISFLALLQNIYHWSYILNFGEKSKSSTLKAFYQFFFRPIAAVWKGWPSLFSFFCCLKVHPKWSPPLPLASFSTAFNRAILASGSLQKSAVMELQITALKGNLVVHLNSTIAVLIWQARLKGHTELLFQQMLPLLTTPELHPSVELSNRPITRFFSIEQSPGSLSFPGNCPKRLFSIRVPFSWEINRKSRKVRKRACTTFQRL